MSKNNNANWDHYKEAGRERQGEDVVHHDEKQAFQGAKAHAERSSGDEPHIPNQERASTPRSDEATTEEEHQPMASSVDGDDVSVPEDEGQVTLSDDEGMVD